MIKKANLIFIIIFLFILNLGQNLQSQIIINEVCPLNHKSLLDDDHSNEDWIELYNPTDTAVNLKGYRISDKNDFEKAWVFPDTTMPPKSYLTLFASDKDRYTDDKFIMETSGEGLYYWVNPEGYSFAYQEYEGDFEAKVRINTFQNGDFFANAGIMVREGLDNSSRFIAFVAREFHVDADIFCKYRDSVSKRINRIEFYHSRDFEYPDVYFQLIRKGNEFTLNFTDISGFIIRTKKISMNLPNRIYLGLSGNSKNRNQVANIFFSNYYINNEKIDFGKLKYFEIYNGLKGKFYQNNKLHTDFKIGNEESIYLFSKNSELLDKVDLPSLKADNTFSRENSENITINSQWGFSYASPNKPNNKLYLGYAENPVFEFDNMIFNSEMSVKIKEIDKTKIYYTINNDEPVISSFLADRNEISLNKTTVIRARSFKDGFLPSDVVTQTFLENYNSKLPAISLSFKPKELQDPINGILNRIESNNEINGNFEFFTNENLISNQQIGTQLHGGLSRTYNQKSFRLYARDIYNCDTLSELLFYKQDLNNKVIKKLDRVVLRSGGQDYFSTKLRDVLGHQLAKNLENLDYLEYNFANLYLNGEYYGITNIIERFDDNFLKTKYDVESEDLNMMAEYTNTLKGNGLVYKSHYDSIMSFNTKDNEYLLKLKSKINYQNFLDYIFLNTFITSLDWSGQNHKTWNVKNSPINFQPYDLDVSLQFYNDYHLLNMFYRMKASVDSTNLNNLFFKIMENDSVRNYFILRACDKINTSFSTDSMISIFNPMVDMIKDYIPAHQARFTESVPNWNEAVDSIRFFLKERPEKYRLHLAEYFNLIYDMKKVKINFEKVKINLNTIKLAKNFEGKYFINQKITLEVDYPKDENFLYWLVNNEKYSTDSKIEILVTEDLNITPVFELKYNKIINNDLNFKSYPNPTNGMVYIELAKNLNLFGMDLQVNIYDNNQKLLNRVKYDKNEVASMDNKLSINLQNISNNLQPFNAESGIYYIQIISDEKVLFFDKIVLN